MRIPRFERHPELIAPPAITARLLDTLSAINRHGPLSTPYLFRLVCPGTKHDAGFIDMLQAAYHHGYVDRPNRLNHPKLWGNPMVYRLSDKGKATLKRHGLALAPVNVSSHTTHDYMVSCITASIEIGARSASYRYIAAGEIVNERKKPFHIPASVKRRFEYDGEEYNWDFSKPLIPDALFGIDYGSTEGFYVLEADRDTEDGFSPTITKNSIISKLLRYQDVMTKRAFESHFDISNLMVLIVTMPQSRVDFFEVLIKRFMRLPMREGGEPGSSYVAMTDIPPFSDFYTPPIMSDLFTREWVRAGTKAFRFG